LPVGAKPATVTAREEEMAQRIRIVVAEDQPLVRTSLCYLLSSKVDFQVVGEAEDGAAAVELAQRHLPDVVVMDYAMPNLSGVEATRQIAAACPAVRVVGHSWRDDEEAVRSMLAAGAVAYVSKTGSVSLLVDAIRQAAHGGEAAERLTPPGPA
jgi:DNA-binding NarL/FixJ family response regulator